MILFRTYFFKKSFQIVFLMITLFLVSCSDDNPEIPAVVEGTEIANFSFLTILVEDYFPSKKCWQSSVYLS